MLVMVVQSEEIEVKVTADGYRRAPAKEVVGEHQT